MKTTNIVYRKYFYTLLIAGLLLTVPIFVPQAYSENTVKNEISTDSNSTLFWAFDITKSEADFPFAQAQVHQIIDEIISKELAEAGHINVMHISNISNSINDPKNSYLKIKFYLRSGESFSRKLSDDIGVIISTFEKVDEVRKSTKTVNSNYGPDFLQFNGSAGSNEMELKNALTKNLKAALSDFICAKQKHLLKCETLPSHLWDLMVLRKTSTEIEKNYQFAMAEWREQMEKKFPNNKTKLPKYIEILAYLKVKYSNQEVLEAIYQEEYEKWINSKR